MNEATLNDLILKISTELAVLNSQTKQVLDTLAKHEERIHKLEVETRDDSFKNEVLKLLAKGTVIALLAFASLSGAGGLIAKFFGQS